MPRGISAKGRAAHQKIMVALVERWERMVPQPSIEELAAELGIDAGSMRLYVRYLRGAGYIHPDAMLITPLGYRHIRGPKGLTN